MGLLPVVPFNLKPYTIAPIILYALYKRILLKQKLRNIRELIISTLIYFVLIISAFYSENKKDTIDLTLRLSPFLLLPFSFSMINKKIAAPLIKLFLKVFIYSCITYSFLIIVYSSFFELTNTANIYAHIRDKFWGFNDHPIYISLYMAISVFSVFSIYNKPLQKFFLLLPLIVIILFFARKGIILSVTLIFLFLRSLREISIYSLIISIITIIILVFSINTLTDNNLFNRFKDFSNINSITQNKTTSTGVRVIVWGACLNLISEAPLFGHGIGDSQTKINQKLKEKGHYSFLIQKSYGKPIYKNAHNQYLQIAVSNGIVGLLAFSFLLFKLLRIFFLEKNELALSIFALIFLSFLFESLLQRQNGILIVAIFVNIFLFGGKIKSTKII